MLARSLDELDHRQKRVSLDRSHDHLDHLGTHQIESILQQIVSHRPAGIPALDRELDGARLEDADPDWNDGAFFRVMLVQAQDHDRLVGVRLHHQTVNLGRDLPVLGFPAGRLSLDLVRRHPGHPTPLARSSPIREWS